ncbi:hypothetical protein H6P81_011825 [Aristolochia fimbriata]|uniref:Uncharacterized protein n=1 Tax=Aristolochia fimbriata TaxID=158543 RepID=A0AAV7EDB4_ARIFI|nr:hypothetical protein H6P81_011825 [Aristolochia fimbriata]
MPYSSCLPNAHAVNYMVPFSPRLHQRLPMQLIFEGNRSYMVPFSLHSDNVFTSLMSQAVPPTIWYRLVAGLNAQLRLVHRGNEMRYCQFGLVVYVIKEESESPPADSVTGSLHDSRTPNFQLRRSSISSIALHCCEYGFQHIGSVSS